MKISSRFFLVLIAFLSVMLSACSMARNMEKVKGVAADYFAAVKDKDYEKALSYYSDEFFGQVDGGRDGWKESLGMINEKLGDLDEYKLTGSNSNFEAGKGTFYTLTYDVTYADYSSKETITLYSKSVKDTILIVGHTINSDGFLKEN